jgi:hypothetical protein
LSHGDAIVHRDRDNVEKLASSQLRASTIPNYMGYKSLLRRKMDMQDELDKGIKQVEQKNKMDFLQNFPGMEPYDMKKAKKGLFTSLEMLMLSPDIFFITFVVNIVNSVMIYESVFVQDFTN